MYLPVMNGYPRSQAKVSLHDRWPLVGGTGVNVIHLARLHSSPPAIFILSTMLCIVIIMYAILNLKVMHTNNITAELLYSTRTLVWRSAYFISGRPLEFHSATMALCGHCVCFDTICVLPHLTSSIAHDAHWSIVIFFDIAGLTQNTSLLRRDVVNRMYPKGLTCHNHVVHHARIHPRYELLLAFATWQHGNLSELSMLG